MNASFARSVFLTENLAYNNLTEDINHITIDILHDMLLLSFTTTCIYCQTTLTVNTIKLVHIHCSKITRALVVLMDCKLCYIIHGQSLFNSSKTRHRYITEHSINSRTKKCLCDSLRFTPSILYDYRRS